jgi:hypothetical protein
MVKTAAFYLVPIKSYSKNTHPPSFLKRAIDRNIDDIRINQMEGKGKKNTNSFFLFIRLSRSTIFAALFNILRYKVILLIIMINLDSLRATSIQRKLQLKEFILIKNEKKADHEVWKHDVSLIGQINTEGV